VYFTKKISSPKMKKEKKKHREKSKQEATNNVKQSSQKT